MIPLPDIASYPSIDFGRFNWFLKAGVPMDTLIRLMPIRTATGIVASDGRFEEHPSGQCFLAFTEAEDVVYWQPRSGELGTWTGRAFALGEDAIYNPGTYAFDCHLNIWPDPLAWLRAKCDGCVILDWPRAWSRLQDAPRIAVHERLLVTYRRHMKPPRGPETFVLTDGLAVAA